MQVSLNTRIELELRQRLDIYVKKTNRSIAQITAEAIEKYLDEKEKKEWNFIDVCVQAWYSVINQSKYYLLI